MDKVTILYNDFSYSVKICDISPKRFQESFELQKPPEFLLDKEINGIIDCIYWEQSLIGGYTYHIMHNTLCKRNADEEEPDKTIGIDDSFMNIVLHSLIASTAVYKMEHLEGDKESIAYYFRTQIRSHSFEYIIPSKHGENFYLIVTEKGFNRIYIAF